MRRPRVRFTIRTALVLNAVVGVGLWVFVVRPAQFRGIAAYHRARWEEQTTTRLEWLGSRIRWISSKTPIGEWHMMMAWKYEQAASRPWMPSGPDPALSLPGQILILPGDFDGTEDDAEPHFGYPQGWIPPTACQPDPSGPRAR
jgi:hypothetical protein